MFKSVSFFESVCSSEQRFTIKGSNSPVPIQTEKDPNRGCLECGKECMLEAVGERGLGGRQ